MIDKRIEKLEDEIQDLTRKLEHLSMGIVILVRKIDPEVYDETLNDLINSNNIS